MAAINMLSRTAMCLGRFSTPLIRVEQLCPNVLIPAVLQLNVQHQQVRTIRKHWNYKFRKLRAAKVIKVDLPDFDKDRNNDDISPEKMRAILQEKGIQPNRPWNERNFYVSNTGTVFEPYVPPEGDGKLSAISVGGAKQKFEFLEKKGKSMMAIRKIKSYEDDFKLQDFVEEATDVYKAAHEALVNFRKDKLKIEDYVTEKAYVEMTENAKYKTIVWKFHKSLSPPKVVHARTTHIVAKDNIFAQVTVRLHTQQSLAIYDRFGRLEYGDENLIKDVLEYVVFEKNISNENGLWRMHHKLIPDWMPVAEPVNKTFRKPDPLPDLPEESADKKRSDESEEEAKQLPAVATA